MMKRVDLSVAPFALQVSSSKTDGGDEADEAKSAVEKNQSEPTTPVADAGQNGSTVRYRECMKNHAASIGGHANDGCGEFMPTVGGDQAGSTLKCAACGCHRNFHRKEVAGGDHHYIVHPSPASVVVGPTPGGGWEQKRVFERFPYLSALPMPPPPQLITTTTAAHLYGGGAMFGGVELRGQNDSTRGDRRSETPDGREDQNMVGLMKNNKRFRTKFTQEQKERMMEFAEKLGWRIQRHDDVALNEFCLEIGVKRRVLKVWMHNNKSALMRKRSDDATAPLPPPAADEDDDDDDDDDEDAAPAREDGPAAESTIGTD